MATIPGVGAVLESSYPQQLGRCWSELLGCPVADNDDAGVSAVKVSDGMTLEFVPTAAVKQEKNRLHLDLSSMSEEHQASLVQRACDLGCRRVDIKQGLVPWVVLADPEGNEFCVLEPRDEYETNGPIAAVVIDAVDPVSLSHYWSSVTELPASQGHPECASLRRHNDAWLEFVRNPRPPRKQGRLHLRLGIAELSIGHPNKPPGTALPDCGICARPGTALSDPEGNHFCLSRS